MPPQTTRHPHNYHWREALMAGSRVPRSYELMSERPAAEKPDARADIPAKGRLGAAPLEVVSRHV